MKTNKILQVLLVIVATCCLISCMKENASSKAIQQKVEQESDNNQTPTRITVNENEWLYGTWKCKTPYGTIKVILQEDGRMYDSINEGWFSYTIEGNRIIEKCNGYISTYNIDRANERFDCGEPGVWFYKE